MCSVHPRGRPRKPPHSRPTPHVRPKVPSPPPSTSEDNTIHDGPKPIGHLNTKKFGLTKWKRIRKFKCKVCGYTTNSQSDANKHYKSSHPKLPCPHCPMTFHNPSSRQWHMYMHKDCKYVCSRCGKCCPFESSLNNHRVVHRRHPTHRCNTESGSCDKWFYTVGNLNKHLKTHQKKVHQCFECSYTTYYPRYLKSHQYTHSGEEKYQCPKCGKHFKHHTQMLRHQGTPDCN